MRVLNEVAIDEAERMFKHAGVEGVKRLLNAIEHGRIEGTTYGIEIDELDNLGFVGFCGCFYGTLFGQKELAMSYANSEADQQMWALTSIEKAVMLVIPGNTDANTPVLADLKELATNWLAMEASDGEGNQR